MNGLLEFLGTHWTTVLEMVLISGGIAMAYRLLRRTPGTRVLLEVIVALLVLTLAAYALKLELVKSFLGFFVLGLVVIFQPELRHAFVSLVGDRLFTPAKTNAELIELLGEVVQQLSAKRFGALFAIERGMDLKQYLETGVEIDSRFAPPLVMTIFHPKTVLHDGGMILKDGRIEGAGCVFPVSQRELNDRSIGLRHRAGLGITEQTDAIAIVVSEETGQISMAHAGLLEQGLSSQLLRQRLSALLSMAPREVEPERERPLSDRTSISDRTPSRRTEISAERPETKRIEPAAERPANATKRLEPRIDRTPTLRGESRADRAASATQRLEA